MLSDNPNSHAYINNIHDAPINDDESNTITSNYISTAADILLNAFGVSGTIISAFTAMLDAINDSGDTTIRLHTTGTSCYADFAFPTSWLSAIVSFDDSPVPITFNLTTTESTSAPFTAYSNISYLVRIVPTDGPIMYYTLYGRDAELQKNLYVSE